MAQSLFFTPGPSQLYPTVPRHLQEAVQEQIGSVSHRGAQGMAIFASCVDIIRQLLRVPNDYHIVFLSSGTECMERIIENCVERTSFHFVNGAFSKRFLTIAQELGRDAKSYEVPWGESFPFEKISFPNDTEMVCFTHNETSTGVSLPMEQIYAYKKNKQDCLIALDIVSSVPVVPLEFRYLDCVFFSVQKGFGLPAGLAAAIISPQAIEKAHFLQQKQSIGSFHNFVTLAASAKKHQTPETPNMLGLFLLQKVGSDMLHLGIEQIRSETAKKATALYHFFDTHSSYTPLVKKKANRSQTVLVVEAGEKTIQIKNQLKKQGIIVGAGYDITKGTHLRIANFPAHTLAQIQQLVTVFSTLV